MPMTRQTVLASRPAAMVLALTLVAGLTAPFLFLPRVKVAAAATAPPPCTESNSNGCTELSPTPPEDTVAVPPNIVLMLDDSGSMAWDYMPDACYLYGVTCKSNYYGDGSTSPINGQGVDQFVSANNDALIDSSNNGVYYNPTVSYVPPPQNDGTPYPSYNDITKVYVDGFNTSSGQVSLLNYSDRDVVGENDPTNGGTLYYSTSRDGTTTSTATFDKTVTYTRHWHKGHHGNAGYYSYTYADQVCQNDFSAQQGASNYSFTGATQDGDGNWLTGECKFTYTSTSTKTYRYFQYSTGLAAGPYVVHYVAQDPANGGMGCGDLSATTTPDCVLDTSPSGLKDANGNDISIGQNIANWFAYDHTRILMAKSGLMTAFNNLNPNYRFGFGSIDGNNKDAISSPASDYSSFSTSYSYTDGNGNTNYIAQAYPFGAAQIPDPSDPTGKALINNTKSRRYQFWNWIVNEYAYNGTPLRKALNAVGTYYKTDQPWKTMPGDPGYTSTSNTKFACRASYAILTTDGFWNGGSPGVGNADDTATTASGGVPSGDIAGYTPASPFQDSQFNTLADVAMYYWANDLQTGISNEVAVSKQDPAAWQHMTTFTMGLGFTPIGIAPNGVTIPQIFSWAQTGTPPSGVTASNFSWPTPSSNSIYNISDLAHAAVNGHGDFFSIKSPQDMAAGFAKAISDINARNVPPTTAAVNASVLTIGALSFSTGYNTGDWSGVLQGVSLKSDGSTDKVLWDAGTLLDAAYHSGQYTNRKVYTDAYSSTGAFSAFQFNAANASQLDGTAPTATVPGTGELGGLETPALAGGNDTLANRIAYILGDNKYEDGSTFRTRSSILGAILHSSPVYVGAPNANYFGNWPTIGGVAPPENASDNQSYDTFQTDNKDRPGMVYVGANDGMLHAFYAPVPQCTGTVDADGNCSAYGFAAGSNPGKEAWAFIPRAVYDNLGNLTTTDFSFRATVDGTPVTRDVYFSENGDNEWRTLLVGGVGLGGRGVYALDITDPSSFSPTTDVLWEFDSDMAVATDCRPSYGSCKATDLGYTISQPNIGRLADGKWVVLVPNGYFPDCSTPDYPTADTTACDSIAAQAPKTTTAGGTTVPYSALFVLDAQTGKMIAELKTPTTVHGDAITSFGLATPVMGDYNGDRVDDVAFAGDAMGNLWRFDFSSTDKLDWSVSLVYKGGTAVDPTTGKNVIQPITSMPRLFPDPSTNRFMVVFGTGKFLGVGDNSNTDVQAIYGVRDPGATPPSSPSYPLTQSELTEQYLHESPAPAMLPDGKTPNPYAGTTLRCVTGSSAAADCSSDSGAAINPVPATGAGSGGWYINLKTTYDSKVTDAGERVVVTPGAIFASNTVVFETLITGAQSSDPCSPSTQGSIMALNATTGAPAGVSSLGGWPVVGARVANAKTSGSLPIVSALGGGQAYLPGTEIGKNKLPLSIDAPIWRRRSWNEIQQNQ